jgi:hypothetical protein
VSPNQPAHDDAQDKATSRLDDMDAHIVGVAARLSASPGAPVADGATSAATGTPSGIRSSPPTLDHDAAMELDPPGASLEDVGEKSDSEAETIVLPGKDNHSPSKIRKSIIHEEKSEDEEMKDAHEVNNMQELQDRSEKTATNATSMLGKRKRQKHGNNKDDTAHLGNSSGLSSVPTSPVATTRSSLSKPAASDSDLSKSPSPRSPSTTRDKVKSVDRVLSRKRAYGSADEDDVDAELRGFGRQRSSGADHKARRDGRSSSKPSVDTSSRKDTRSISPHSRGHRRSISTQLPSKSSHGLSHKKKRIPAPLQSTDYHSDESSASGNSHPRSSRLRHLAPPTTGDSTAMSPAKMAPHKKHVNSSGQTLLARACTKGKLDVVQQRYEERPQDLNEADHALNTPLHFASLHGFADVVKFLLDAHCSLDNENDRKETPLHDAVENGHAEVVKLLLDAGASPNKPNIEGDEPLDLLNDHEDEEDEDEDLEKMEEIKEARLAAAEIRAAIMEAKKRFITEDKRGSEDEQIHDITDNRLSHPAESPRQTPPAQAHEPQGLASTNRKVGTARSMKTRDRNLYQRLDQDELNRAAREGDEDLASRILDIYPRANDPKTLLLAAKGGHSGVMNIMFAMGSYNPDPNPLEGIAPEQATPILAAIGKGYLEVIKLFLGNADFDPTRRIKGETYYEIAKRRAGKNWQEEESLFKEAFENYQKTHKSPAKPRSPGLRRDGREADRDARKLVRRDEHQASRSHKRSTSSPKTKEQESGNTQHRDGQSKDGQNHVKRGPGRPRKEESTIIAAISDRETSPLGPPKQKSQSKRSESDVAPGSENEPTVKPRRKLVSRGERELEKQRRASVASNASSASVKEKRERGTSNTRLDGRTSPSVPRMSKSSGTSPGERDLTSEKHSSDKDRARSLKRDDSKDRLTAIRGESPVKRPRKSETPPRSSMQEVTGSYGMDGAPPKRRKLEGASGAGHKTDGTPSSSPEHRTATAKSNLSRENTAAKSTSENKVKASRSVSKSGEALDEIQNRPNKSAKPTPGSGQDPPSRKPKTILEDTQSISIKVEEEDSARQAKIRREKEELEAQRQREKEQKEMEQKEREQKEKEQKEKEQKEKEQKEKEEQEELARIEQAKQARLAREQAAREEEERRQREEAERKERQRIEDAEAHNRAMEEQRALYVEQERLKREEQERRRAIVLEQQRAERARIEKEKREERLSKLPRLLKWLDMASDPKTPEIAKIFSKIVGYRYDTIRPELTGQPNGREQWMLNTHVAVLLGEKDLQLSRCKSLTQRTKSSTNIHLRHCLGTYTTLKCREKRGLEGRKRTLFTCRWQHVELAQTVPA